MFDQNAPPNERANARVLGLIRGGTESLKTDSFDPWAMAHHDLKLDAVRNPSSIECESMLEAWELQKAFYLEADRVYAGAFMHGPNAQVAAASFCLSVKNVIEAGDGVAVMEAIAQCAAHGLVLPNWLSAAFIERYQRVMSGECKGWGEVEAFGAIVPKGKNLAGVVAVSRFSPWAYEVAVELLSKNANRPIDVSLYEEIGLTIGRSATQVQSLIKQYLKEGLYPPLRHVKDGLLAGKCLAEVCGAWVDEKHQAALAGAGWSINAQGELVELDIKKT